MKGIEADEAELAGIQKQIEEQKRNLERIRKESEQLAAKYEVEIKEIQAEWSQASQTVPSEPLGLFNRVADTYDGEAMAVIERQEGRTGTYTCGGCFMGIPAESVNILMTKDDIIRCPNCTRILVLGDMQEI
jgi:uncharacterized protein